VCTIILKRISENSCEDVHTIKLVESGIDTHVCVRAFMRFRVYVCVLRFTLYK
jgi:hypothetical protein